MHPILALGAQGPHLVTHFDLRHHRWFGVRELHRIRSVPADARRLASHDNQRLHPFHGARVDSHFARLGIHRGNQAAYAALLPFGLVGLLLLGDIRLGHDHQRGGRQFTLIGGKLAAR